MSLSNQKEILLFTELYKKYSLGQIDFDDTKNLVQNSSNDRLSYLLSSSDSRIKFELIVCLLSELPTKRNMHLLNPYVEFVRFIKAIHQNFAMDVLEELYFLAQEQIKTKYVPIGTYEISRLL